MDFGKLDRLAEDLARTTSRFELAKLKKMGLMGNGKLAGLSRFEMAQVEQLYEAKRAQ